jgi:hypothetical protein
MEDIALPVRYDVATYAFSQLQAIVSCKMVPVDGDS